MLSVQSPGYAGMERLGVPVRTTLASSADDRYARHGEHHPPPPLPLTSNRTDKLYFLFCAHQASFMRRRPPDAVRTASPPPSPSCDARCGHRHSRLAHLGIGRRSRRQRSHIRVHDDVRPVGDGIRVRWLRIGSGGGRPVSPQPSPSGGPPVSASRDAAGQRMGSRSGPASAPAVSGTSIAARRTSHVPVSL